MAVPADLPRVVSSTWLDLQPERRALMDALNRMEEMRFVGMEFFGNRPDDTHDASIDQVNQCEIFVGIIGHRYGSGITEAEYRRARALGLPCFVYFKRQDSSQPGESDNDAALAARLAAFKQDLLRDHTVKEFTSPDELAASATADLHHWVAARWISVEPQASVEAPAPVAPPDADRTNILRLLERIEQDWIEGVLEALMVAIKAGDADCLSPPSARTPCRVLGLSLDVAKKEFVILNTVHKGFCRDHGVDGGRVSADCGAEVGLPVSLEIDVRMASSRLFCSDWN